MQWALVDSNNVVVNIIVIDPEKEYKPPQGLALREINDWVHMGRDADMPKPTDDPPQTDEERKAQRDTMAKNNLSLIAVFNMEKKSKPDLTFSTYLDELESTAKPTL